MSAIEPITVAGCQIQQELGNPNVNIQTGLDAIRLNPAHDIYVLPELSSSGYGEPVFQQLKDLAEDWDGPSYKAFSRLSRELGCYICYSFPRRRSANEFTIAAVNETTSRMAKHLLRSLMHLVFAWGFASATTFVSRRSPGSLL